MSDIILVVATVIVISLVLSGLPEAIDKYLRH